MKNYASVLGVLMVMLFSITTRAQKQEGGLTWYDDINKAYEVSAKTHKPVFAFFTGSDWCGWCHKLQADVLSKPQFVTWAQKNVILLELDFPRGKKLPDNIAQQNASLQDFFKVQGYPTVWIFNMAKDAATNKYSLTALGSLGYPQCEKGKELNSFLDKANTILKSGTASRKA